MIDQSLLDYIKQASLKGVEKLEITSQLLSDGWTQDSIDEAFEKSIIDTSHQLELFRHWLVILIVARLILIPIQYFFLTLDSGTFFSLGNLLNASLLGSLLPLIWFVPLTLIHRREGTGYVLAIVFAIILVYLNFAGLFVLLQSTTLGIISFIHFIVGVLTVILAYKCIKLSSVKKEVFMSEQEVNEPKKLVISIVLVILFGFATIAPVLIAGPGFNSFFNISFVDIFIPSIIVILLGMASGMGYARQLITAVQKQKLSLALTKGVTYGAGLGAMAQIPLYGLNGLLIFAVPIGAVIGIVVGVISAYILYFIAEKVLVQK